MAVKNAYVQAFMGVGKVAPSSSSTTVALAASLAFKLDRAATTVSAIEPRAGIGAMNAGVDPPGEPGESGRGICIRSARAHPGFFNSPARGIGALPRLASGNLAVPCREVVGYSSSICSRSSTNRR